MMEQDIRWEQRFSNYLRALDKLRQSVEFIQKTVEETPSVFDDENKDDVFKEMLEEGLIHRFKYTHELAWNVMKDYAEYQGNTNIGGSRDATREAFQMQLIQNGRIWMDMISSRNKTSHTYNVETAIEIYRKILHDYYPEFMAFKQTLEKKRRDNNKNDIT